MISFQLFIEKVKSDMQERLKGRATIKVTKVLKNNGIKETAMTIMAHETTMGPTCYLKPYYDVYVEGLMSMEMITNMIYDIFNTFELSDHALDALKDFESLKDRVFYNLVSYERNPELLEDVPYMPYLDLALVFYVLVDRSNEGQSIFLIHNHDMTVWDTDTDTLYELAKVNTPRLFPASIENLKDIMERIGRESLKERYDDKVFEDLFAVFELNPLYALSNEGGVNGAVVILYEGVLKDFAEMAGSDLVVILPSSIHETLLVPYKKELDMGELKKTVGHINRAEVPTSDILSDSVYLYDKDKDMVYLLPDSDTQ